MEMLVTMLDSFQPFFADLKKNHFKTEVSTQFSWEVYKAEKHVRVQTSKNVRKKCKEAADTPRGRSTSHCKVVRQLYDDGECFQKPKRFLTYFACQRSLFTPFPRFIIFSIYRASPSTLR